MTKPQQTNDLPLMLAAAMVMCLVVSRAAIQSATLDEASSYLGYVALDWPSHWYATSGNHVLNSIVVRLFNTVFGLSHPTFRSGAILGAAIYLTAVYRLCTELIERAWVRWPAFLCLTLNPFILDYLVASRGYSLALGFLMAAVFLAARVIAGPTPDLRTVYRQCALASSFIALSFCASFPFAFADLAVILFLWAWALFQDRNRWYAVTAACFIPGLLITIAIAGSVLLDWPKGQLYFGAANVREMWHSLVSSSFYEVNPQVVNPLLRPVLNVIRRALPNVFYVVSIALMVLLALRSYSPDSKDRRVARVCGYLIAVLALSFSLYWLSHRLFGMLFPKDRTAIFFVPLAALAYGLAASIRPASRVGLLVRGLSVTVLYAAAIYFTGCLRLTYFKEWKFDADVKTAFETALAEEQKSGTHDLVSSWEFNDSLKFYELYYHRRQPFLYSDVASGTVPAGKAIYILNNEGHHDFIEKQQLKVIYHGEPSDIVVAIRP